PVVREGRLDFSAPERRDPWRKDGVWTTPVVAAVQGWVMTLAIELLLGADIRIAASDSRFAQLEIRRGIYAFGGATIRLPRDAGGGTRCAGCSPARSTTPPRRCGSGSSRRWSSLGVNWTGQSSSPTRSPPSPRRWG